MSKKKFSYKKTTLWMFLIAILLFLFNFLFPKVIPSITYRFFSPFWRIEVENRKVDYEKDVIRNFLDSELLKENIELKLLLNRTSKDLLDDTVLGVVLKRPPSSPYDSFIIDVGEDHGVYVGSRVYVNGGFFVGKIEEVFPRFSKAILLSSPSYSLDSDLYISKSRDGERDKEQILIDQNIFINSSPLKNNSEDNTEDIIDDNIINSIVGDSILSTKAFGRGGGTFEIVVPIETDIKIGDKVVVGDIKSLPIGKIERIDIDEARSFKSLFFRFPFSIYKIKYVQVQVNK